MAVWALSQLATPHAFRALANHWQKSEREDAVKAEWQAGLSTRAGTIG
jgi:hypothetical protein